MTTDAASEQATEESTPSGPAVVLFSVWNMTGGPVPEEAIAKIEKLVARVFSDFEKHEGVRLVTQTTRAD